MGKRIKCPKCAFVFRAGPKQTEEIYAELDEDDFASAAQIPAASLVQPVQYAPQPASQVHALPPSPRPQHGTARPRKQKQAFEMTDAESYCQSSGLFLIFLPLLATVLPLFGLQLRRLTKAGEFAPLAAMVLGLIGVGMICYARRRQGDAPLYGSAAAALVLISGVGGFFLVSTLGKSSPGNFDLSTQRNQPVWEEQIEAEGFANNASDFEAHRDSLQKAHEAMQQQVTENRNRAADFEREFANQQKEMAELHRQAMKAHEEAMKDLGRQGNGFATPPDFSPPDFPTGPPNIPTPPNFSPPRIPNMPDFSPPRFPGRRMRPSSSGPGRRN
jgi:hypothetical protein